MKRFIFVLLTIFLLPHSLLAADNSPIEVRFTSLEELGAIAKPRTQISTVREAFNFIMADKIVRLGINKAMKDGYKKWKVVAEKIGNKNEVLWLVTITSKTKIPPFMCYFRFDRIGNDMREIPGNGCQYE